MMWRNVCNGCQDMPQVSIAVDPMAAQGGGIQCTAARPETCGEFFRQHTELRQRPHSSPCGIQGSLTRFVARRIGQKDGKVSHLLGFNGYTRMDTSNGICATA